ncbi:uncharacterized protein LOC143915270 [Arctopsyche grandis]|uniref:uncharacterized protein LOC143915270 n=1 Tax=Arctopsyche grandis TaxID=121162 RepID=UPI00406D9EEF
MNELSMEVKIVVVYFLLTFSSIFADEVVKIGKSIYTKERIAEYDEDYQGVKRIGVNSVGDIYTWSGFMPQYLKAGSSKVEYVPGLRSRVIHGFAIDSKDNFFFNRIFDGMSYLKPGQKEENTLAGIHRQADTMVIDIHDNMYLGSYYMIDKVILAEHFDDYEESSLVQIPGFKYGFNKPAAIDSKGNIYYEQVYSNFYYQNFGEGSSSKRKIAEIGEEETHAACVDSMDNVYVATIQGLFFIEAGTKGIGIEKVEAFADKFVGSVHVDWRKNDTIYLVVKDEGLLKLTYKGRA